MKNARIVFFIIALILSFASCETHDRNISELYIRELAEGDFKVPSEHSFDKLFVLSNNRQIAQTNVSTLKAVYVRKFSSDFSTFFGFLSCVLNQKVTVPEEELNLGQVTFFVIDEDVAFDATKSSIKAYLDEYCIRRDSGGYILKDDSWKRGSVETILYYLFINNFQIQSIDSEESYIIVPLE